MITEVRGNGSTSIHITGARPMEIQAISEILDAASKSQKISITAGESEHTLIISVSHENKIEGRV